MHHLYEIGGGFIAGVVLSKLYFGKAVAELAHVKAIAKAYGYTAINKL